MFNIKEINRIIDEEIEYAKEINSFMALGMEQIKRKLNIEYATKEMEELLKK